MKKVIVIGSGLGGISTALRLASKGHDVTILEKYKTPGGRLNQIILEGFKFDMGPSFMSMTFELDELFDSIGEKNPLTLTPLEPLYQVFFEGNKRPYKIYKDLKKLEEEFKDVEPNLAEKADKYLHRAGKFFHDTEDKVVKSNFDSKLEYIYALSKVPMKHLPYLFRNMWDEVERTFSSEEIRIIFSLVAFFLGSTPFQTPSIYSLLNYTEMRHNGYWKIEGGMYRLVEVLNDLLKKYNVKTFYDTEILNVISTNGSVDSFVDQNGEKWQADIFVSNSDAAAFRGKVLNRKNFSEEKLDKMDWTLAPFTIYLGVKGEIPILEHHNYFLGNNFRDYANEIFTTDVIPNNPYYYVNVSTKSFKECAPESCENIFILCPVPDLRFKKDWMDKEDFANVIIKDLSKRIDFDLDKNTLVKKILSPFDWKNKLNLYKGSGLGLAHGIMQVGAFRPRNKDEYFDNLYYVGASTTPGTGLPMVIISSRLVTERVEKDHGTLS